MSLSKHEAVSYPVRSGLSFGGTGEQGGDRLFELEGKEQRRGGQCSNHHLNVGIHDRLKIHHAEDAHSTQLGKDDLLPALALLARAL